ncbi:uncharacterized protein LOC116691056 isoform X2 [Etheostoma spectabile]|uniref:uncharacterized protein LOC116691056 isoform X2 n=1 Tax=Etheostoma spectabile TaxID=54343 RepID=UPI0013AFE6BF|nr:uncharacterized protein LOC116691056 isoform X2 [Etheostoma spectabile]
MLVNLKVSFLDQMKLPDLIDLSFILILVSNSKGKNWTVTVDRRIDATPGSNVTIPCYFTYPVKYHTEDVQVHWKVKNNLTGFNEKLNAFVFHPNDTYVLEKYRGKTKLTGDKAKGDCTLKIFKILEYEKNIYVRVLAKDNYSFKKDLVTIGVSGNKSVSLKPDFIPIPSPTFETTESDMAVFSTVGTPREASLYMAIFVPVAALLIIIFVIAIVLCLKKRRSQSFTREESGYYENVSRASSNQAKRKTSCTTQDNKKLSELKAIDEPVYINIEAIPGQMDQSMDHTDNTYGNVDYEK